MSRPLFDNIEEMLAELETFKKNPVIFAEYCNQDDPVVVRTDDLKRLLLYWKRTHGGDILALGQIVEDALNKRQGEKK